MFQIYLYYLLSGSPHLTQEEILNYSHVDDFEVSDDEIDASGRRQSHQHPPMTDDESDDSEIDLENPYETNNN